MRIRDDRGGWRIGVLEEMHVIFLRKPTWLVGTRTIYEDGFFLVDTTKFNKLMIFFHCQPCEKIPEGTSCIYSKSKFNGLTTRRNLVMTIRIVLMQKTLCVSIDRCI